MPFKTRIGKPQTNPRCLANLRRGPGPGRPKGRLDKPRRDLAAVLRAVQSGEDTEAIERFGRDLRNGKLPQIMAMLVRDVLGEPPQDHHVTITPLTIAIAPDDPPSDS